ncbi:MAG: tRNA 2-thiouridine(34) synthase MnmA [Thermoanaerobaculales bacterium]
MGRIAVLCSGGVDSSVALVRLAEKGQHELTAFYLRIWLEDELAYLGHCPWEEDLAYVRDVCAVAGVPLEVISLQREYLDTVVAYAVEELREGHTPSPDVICNLKIKFGAFLDRIDEQYEWVASGHHARTTVRNGQTRLLRGADPRKDQTYFLCLLRQSQLTRCLFPIGHMNKAQVRAEAKRLTLPNADRPDSQGICFLGRVPFNDFVRHHLGERPGEIRETRTGKVLGEHRGTWFHTIGQRRGLGLAGGPWYVVEKNTEHDLVLVVHGDELDECARSRFCLPEPHWIAGPPQRNRLEVRIRHGERLAACVVRFESDDSLTVDLDEADPGVAPGQFAALYDGEECLGGGTIAWKEGLK